MGRARAVILAQLVLGTVVLALAGIGYAESEGTFQVLLMILLAGFGLGQLVPAVAAERLLRRDRVRTGLFISGAAAFVPGAMIAFLAVTSFRAVVLLVVGPVGVVLMGLGFHQLWLRSRLA
jgi:hypothetical protein